MIREEKTTVEPAKVEIDGNLNSATIQIEENTSVGELR